MIKDNLHISIKIYLSTKDRARDDIFKREILPFLEDIINGVFLSLRINGLSQEEIQDVRQEIYLKLLTRFETKGLKGIRSTKNYLFISVKNIVIDHLRGFNRDKKFNEDIKEIILNPENNGVYPNR